MILLLVFVVCYPACITGAGRLGAQSPTQGQDEKGSSHAAQPLLCSPVKE